MSNRGLGIYVAAMTIGAMLLACAIVYGIGRYEAQNPAEFVCETAGELTEHHVGVAWARSLSNGIWRIKYVDGDRSWRYYRQRAGETCTVERAP